MRKTNSGEAIAGANAIADVSGASCQRLKPGLTASEACHRLAPIEGQKEIARRLKAVQKEKRGKEEGDEQIAYVQEDYEEKFAVVGCRFHGYLGTSALDSSRSV